MFFEKEIKAALLKAGLAENLVDKIKVEKVEDIEDAVTILKTSMDKDENKVKELTDEEFRKTLKEAGLEDIYLKHLNSESDRRVQKALETNVVKAIKDQLKIATDDELKNKTKVAAKEKEQSAMTTDQKEMAVLKETINSLKETVEGFKTSFTAQSLESVKLSALKEAGLKENMVSYVVGDNPEQIASAVLQLKNDVDTHAQANIDKQLEAGDLALGKVGTAGKSVEESAIADFAKSETMTAETGGLAAEQALAIEKK